MGKLNLAFLITSRKTFCMVRTMLDNTTINTFLINPNILDTIFNHYM